MAKIAFILLCHKDPDAIIAQAQTLTAAGDCVAIHFDSASSAKDFRSIRAALADNPDVTVVARRVRCGWGEWSLVEATLRTLAAALDAFPRATHFYLLSGDCMSIKSAEYAHDFLDRHDVDYIESVDFHSSGWIRTGWTQERLVYRHWFNERSQPRRFYAMFEVQKRLGLTRRIPRDLDIMIGSQWWCLRRRTVESLLEFAQRRGDVMRFFRGTWIPDETFFQTLVRHIVPETEIDSRTLTFLLFSDYGMPVTFYNDHYDLLLSQNYLFARKISPEAAELRQRLGALYVARGQRVRISNEGRALYAFLTAKGRSGNRFGQRFWERESTLGRERELLIVICKKRAVARRLLTRIEKVTDLPAIGYLFDEDSAQLPDLGGLQTTLVKRHRHRRALLRMLYDYYDSDRMVICLDPANMDLIEDFCRDRAVTRLLEITCRFDDSWLADHARRAGLAGDHTAPEAMDGLLTTIRNDLIHESDRIRDAGFDNHLLMRETDSAEEKARRIAMFLSVAPEAAAKIVASDTLFAD